MKNSVENIFRLVMVLMVLLIATSCSFEKKIEIIPKSNYSGEVFIEGMLIPGQVPQIYISSSQPFFNKKVTPQEVFARGATVTLTTNGVVSMLQPDSTFDQFRCRWTPYYSGGPPAQWGQAYDLSITYNGQTYSASTIIEQPKVEIQSIDYIGEFFDVYGGHDGVAIEIDDLPGPGNFYRFRMDRMIDNDRLHAHILDVLQPDCSNGEMFPVTDLGRTIFSDENIDGQRMRMLIEVSFEYKAGDSTWVMIQSLDAKSAEFFTDLDDQLESILNPFVEPVFLKSQIQGAFGVFGSAVLSDSVLFIYPVDNP